MTINQYISLIETFATDHPQISDSRFEVEYNIHGDKKHDGFVLWYFIEGSNTANTMISNTFVFTCMDVINNDRSNLADILSDSLQILQDLEAYFLYQTDEGTNNFDLVRNSSFEPGQSRFNDDFAGHTVRITLQSEFTYDQCAIPVITPIPEGDWILTSGFWDDLGVWVDTDVWID